MRLRTIVALIVTPLLVAQAMPEPMSQLTLPRFVPVRVEPPVAPVEAPARATSPPKTGLRPRLVDVLATAPPEIPDGIPERDDYFAGGDSMGVAGGLPPSLGGRQWVPEPVPEPAGGDPEPILIVGNVRPPRKVFHVAPVYPALARQARAQGTVKLRAVIDTEGRVANVVVVDSVPLLDRAAIEAVQQWRYEPTLQNGRAVAVIMTVEVVFTLER